MLFVSVPSFSFGETSIFTQVSQPKGSFLNTFQETVKQITGVMPCVFNGRGFFQYSFGLMPLSSPITVVVGKPIPVAKNENPTSEEIEALHSLYMQQLNQLYVQVSSHWDETRPNFREMSKHSPWRTDIP